MTKPVHVVTGASSGIGRAAAAELARRGVHVILVARDPVRGADALTEARAAGAGDAELAMCDLADLDSVRRLASDLLAKQPRIDVLINCASVFKTERTLTAAGFEVMFATNHLGPFLLTNLLLERLRASAPARIVTVTAPSTTQIDFDDLHGEHRFRPLWAFGATKMANLVFTFELAARLDGTGVSANAVHPEVARTRLMHEAPLPIRLLTAIMGTSARKAASRVVEAAIAPGLAGVSGQLLKGLKAIEASAVARDPDVRRQLWSVSEKLTGLRAP